MDWNQITIAIISALSVLAGVGLSEYFKRKERESFFSEVIFEKKISIYEDLFQRLETIREKAFELIDNKTLSKEARLQAWSSVVLPFAQFLDKSELYINENIKLHAIVSVVGVEEIHELAEKARKKRVGEFNLDIKKAMDMIKEELGIKRLDKFFTKLNEPNLESRWTEYVKTLKKRK